MLKFTDNCYCAKYRRISDQSVLCRIALTKRQLHFFGPLLQLWKHEITQQLHAVRSCIGQGADSELFAIAVRVQDDQLRPLERK